MMRVEKGDKELTEGFSALRADRIRHALTERFQPERLTVTDDSAKHAGHAGARPEGETHFTVVIVTAAFAGMGRLARHRAVTDALAKEFDTGLHALAIVARAPGEAA
jgi:BolA protein